MTAYCRRAVHLAAIMAFALGLRGWHTSDWTLAAQSKGHQGIAVVVNGEAITAYDVEQRARLLTLGNKQVKENLQRLHKAEGTNARLKALRDEVIRTNQGKSREEVLAIWEERQKQLGTELRQQAIGAVLPRLRKEAKEQLIEERIKLQEAKKLGVELSSDDVKRLLKMVADQNKLSLEQLGQNLKGMGIDIATMGERFKAREAWALFVRRRYGAQVSVTLGDVDRLLATTAAEDGGDTVELQLHKITLGLAGRSDQSAWARRFAEAEALQRRYKGCSAMDQLARGVPEARFQDMKHVKLGKIAEPIRSMLAGAKDGDVLPPFITDAGVELYAVCGRRTTVGDEEQRAKARAELQSQELAKLARRHLRNLKQDATIEDRNK